MSIPDFDLSAPASFPLAIVMQDQAPQGDVPPGDSAEKALTLEQGTATDAVQGEAPPSWLVTVYNLMPLILIGLLFYFLIIGSGKKRERQRQEMLSTLARGDRITTIGGIIGNVVDANSDEVVLKVDENNNTKIRITRAAVASVAKGDAGRK